jgi:Ca2+:H+ antiporter
MFPRHARLRPVTGRPLLTLENALFGLLVFLPLAAAGSWLSWDPRLVFASACLAIVPLAGVLGRSTEQLAARLGAGAGGLLNATFGNAAELIIALAALERGLYGVVKASVTGSIIGNVLLVLGGAFLAGGFRRERLVFDRSAAAAGSTLLALAAIGLIVPALFHHVAESAVEHAALTTKHKELLEHGLSLEIAVILFASYGLSLLFSLRTHRHLYAGQMPGRLRPGDTVSPARATLALLIATALIAWMSELLVGTVEHAAHDLGFTQVFVGVIVVAVIGNAAEHSTAVLAAWKDQADLAMNIAIGSSIQIALFVAPVLVFASRFMPHGPMDLRFTTFEVVSVAVAMVVLNLVAQDGEANWLEGALMLAVYGILGTAFYLLP